MLGGAAHSRGGPLTSTSWKELRAERAKEPGFDEAYRRARLALEVGSEPGVTESEFATANRSTQPRGAASKAAAANPPRSARHTRIVDLEGVGPVYAQKLSDAGIGTIEALLKEAGSVTGRKSLSESTGIDSGLILEWVNRADSMRIKGVGSEYSDLLENAGVDSVRELARRRPDNLHGKMIEVHEAKKLVHRAPSLGEVERWVAQAKSLVSAVPQ